MEDIVSFEKNDFSDQERLYFWAFGDLHYRARHQWHAMHSRRLAPMFQDVRQLWLEEGNPAFCVSPGDIVDTGAPENYRLARLDLTAQLGNVPFYAGIGNHEYHAESREDTIHTAREFSEAWDRPLRYTWTIGDSVCIMLDQPNPYVPNPEQENPRVIFSAETLAFLDAALTEFSDLQAVIFAHCPLRDTVLDRDPDRNLDDDSQDAFFYVENSQDVRAILAEHANAGLYFSGHTHSGWGSPNLVMTETLGDHSLTHVNLMSPWYTGRRKGPRLSVDRTTLEYIPDDPDVLASFAVHILDDRALIRLRDHRAGQWLTQWVVPLG